MNYLIAIISVTALIFGYTAWDANDGVGAISFPTSLDTLTNPSATDSTATVSHSGQHSDANDAIEALQAKVGADSSAVNTTHDFKLSGVADGDYACSLTGTEILTNKTLTSPTLTSPTINSSTLSTTTLSASTTFAIGSDATGDVFYRDSSGQFQRLGIGSSGQYLIASSTGIPEWTTISPAVPTVATTRASTASLTVDGTSQTRITFSAQSTSNCIYTSPCTVTMKLGGTVIATTSISTADANADDTFSMFYVNTPAATTSATLSISGTSVTNPYWIVEIY